MAQQRKSSENGEPIAGNGSYCLPGGMPGAMSPPKELSLQILETPSQVTVLFEFYGTYRVIHLNQEHPLHPDPTSLGYSVGHWEGDTLVVDTIGLTPNPLDPTDTAQHLVERIRRTGKDTLEDLVTIDDPKTYTKAWTRRINLKYFPGSTIGEFVCDNQRNGVDADGHTKVELKSSK